MVSKLFWIVTLASLAVAAAQAGNGPPPPPAPAVPVPIFDGWGLLLLIGLMGGVLGRWLMGRGRRK